RMMLVLDAIEKITKLAAQVAGLPEPEDPPARDLAPRAGDVDRLGRARRGDGQFERLLQNPGGGHCRPAAPAVHTRAGRLRAHRRNRTPLMRAASSGDAAKAPASRAR